MLNILNSMLALIGMRETIEIRAVNEASQIIALTLSLQMSQMRQLRNHFTKYESELLSLFLAFELMLHPFHGHGFAHPRSQSSSKPMPCKSKHSTLPDLLEALFLAKLPLLCHTQTQSNYYFTIEIDREENYVHLSPSLGPIRCPVGQDLEGQVPGNVKAYGMESSHGQASISRFCGSVVHLILIVNNPSICTLARSIRSTLHSTKRFPVVWVGFLDLANSEQVKWLVSLPRGRIFRINKGGLGRGKHHR